MKIVKISREISVGPHPDRDGLESLKKKGFHTIVNLSAKGELGEVLTPDEEAESAAEFGLGYLHIPISLSSLKTRHIDDFVSALQGQQGPFYIHCRLGQRSQPLGMIYHAICKGLSRPVVEEKATKLGITPEAPFIYDFMMRYVENAAESA